MSNIGSRFKKLITEPKVTVKKISHKFKYDRKGAFQLISSEIRGDSKRIYQKVRKHLPIKYHGKHNFTIVSACYNVDKYLNEYFKSIINQSLDFKKHIQIICVDDGSSDNTAAIIKQWQEKYPNNIHYIYKENGGQASARNLGLESVKTEWVTFIDPDDFISGNYFEEIDRFIIFNPRLSLIGTPLVFYFEESKLFKNTHPLKYRFSKGNVIHPISDLKDKLQLSASTSIFKTKLINGNYIIFDEMMKPSFEDAKFVSDYIISNSNKEGLVGFVSNISYFYRKREDGSSTLDGAWQNPLLFSTVLSNGCLAILEDAKDKFGYVPEYIQRIPLYHISWYFSRIVDNPAALSHLDVYQKEEFVKLLFNIFEYIDSQTIMKFNLAGIWFYQKIAWLGLFKNIDPPENYVYVDRFDTIKKQLLVYYFSKEIYLENWKVDGMDTIPLFLKRINHKFLDKLYTIENRLWIPCNNMGDFEVLINNKIVKVNFNGKLYTKLNLNEVENFYLQKLNNTNQSWIFMDRDNQADDNAEHLYRYVKDYKKDNIYYALNKSSKDWGRLEKDGFNLLAFGTPEFETKLKGASKLISSHIDGYFTHYFSDNSLTYKDYVFLQHGITKDDLSSWLNTKKISCFITATQDEYNSISRANYPYKVTEKEVVLTGFPRYDRLWELKLTDSYSKTILIMPTWRSNIVGKYIQGTERERNPLFMETNYATHWHRFINAPELQALAKQYEYRLVFAPHPNIQEYMDVFTLPDSVELYQFGKESIQNLFARTDILITDYSSVAFDIAYLGSSVLYYQFDADEVFNSQSHTYRKGYFSYQDDGFGAIASSLDEMLYELDKLLRNNGEPLEPYKTRINATFPFRDGLNCERVYQAIKSLDAPEEKVIDLDILQDYTISAYENARWDLLISRCNLLEKYGDNVQQQKANYMKSLALIETYQFDEVDFDVLSSSNRIQLQARQAFLQEEWQKTIDYLTMSEFKLDREQLFMLLRCYAELKRSSDFSKLSSKLIELTENEKLILQSWDACGKGDWFTVIALLKDKVMGFSQDELSKYKPQLLLSSAFRQIGQYSESHNQLVDYEKHINNDASCRIEIARLAFIQENYGKVITQLERASRGFIINLPEKVIIEFLVSLEKTKQTHKVSHLLNEIMDKRSSAINALFFILIRRQNWKKIIELAEPLYSNLSKEVVYPLILAKMRMGLIDDAYKLYIKPTSDFPYEYWEIISDLAVLKNNSELASFCFQNMITLFPDRNKESNLQKLIFLSK